MSQYEMPDSHERVVRALREGGPAVPPGLQRRIEQAVREAPTQRRAPPLRWRLPALAAVTATAALALVLVLAAGGEPGVNALAAIARQPATEQTPGQDPSQPTLLRREFEGVAFPNWSQEFGWSPIGARTETIDGREASTVFYTHHGHRIAYTVLAGEPIEPPKGALAMQADGVDLHRSRHGELDVVTFVRNGRTCVLAGDVINPSTLVELASWQGDGAVRF
jgi:hypothetical protein